MAAAAVPRPAPASPSVAPAGAKDRLFYSAMAIAMALMGLMFLSSRSGRDEHAHAAWRQRDGNGRDVR